MNDDYDVQLRLTEGTRNSADEVTRLYVPTAAGTLDRLDNLVELRDETTSSRIDRLDRQRQVNLRAAPGSGPATRSPTAWRPCSRRRTGCRATATGCGRS